MKISSFGIEPRQFVPPLFAKRKEKLYVLFIPTSYVRTTPETFFAKVEESLRDSFYSYRGGVIGALKKALSAAGHLLYSRQAKGAIFCLAEGKAEAYLAIAGPVTAIIQQRGKLKSLTGSSPAPGESPEPKPLFFSFPLESGSTLALVPAVDEVTLRHLEEIAKSERGEKILISIQETIGPRSWGVVLEFEVSLPAPSVKPLMEKLKGLGRQVWELLAPAKEPAKKPLQSRNHWAKVIALAIPLLVIFLVLLAYFQQVRVVNSRIDHLLQNARASISQASSAQDITVQREALKAAARALEEARLLRPMAPQIKEVEKAFQEQYDKAYKIIRNFPVVTLQRFQGAKLKPRRLVVNGRDIYILDSGTDELYLYRLNEVGDALADPDKPTALLKKGQVVEDLVVGELVEMAFYLSPQPETEKGLLVLDSSANLYRITFPWGAIRRLSLAPGFSYSDRMKTLDKRLYILDRARGQIWRYIPGEGGYPSPPTPYFPRPISMEEVRDFALDGYVYLLMADGRILKFLGGTQVPFEMEQLDRPLVNPSVIFTFPEEDLERPQHPLYVADSGQKRIIELDKGGKLLRQFVFGKEDEFLEIADFAVDERKKTAFILTPESLFILFLP